MSLTYKELVHQILDHVPHAHMDDDVTVLLMDKDEVFSVIEFVSTTGWLVKGKARKKLGIDQVEGVLDDGHPYLTVDA